MIRGKRVEGKEYDTAGRTHNESVKAQRKQERRASSVKPRDKNLEDKMRRLEEKKREMLALERQLETEMRLSGRSMQPSNAAAETAPSPMERNQASPSALQVPPPLG